MTENIWYYEKDGEPIGPFQKRLIASFLRSGVIKPETLVWEEGGEKRPVEVALAEGDDAPTPAAPTAPTTPTPAPAPEPAPKAQPATEMPPQPAATPQVPRPTAAPHLVDTPPLPFMMNKPLPHDLSGWQILPPAPWRRGLARLIDLLLVTQMLGIVLWAVAHFMSLGTKMFLLMMISVKVKQHPYLWTFISGLFVLAIATVVLTWIQIQFKTTPGKWAMGIRVLSNEFKPLSAAKIAIREAYAGTIGAGLYMAQVFMALPIWWFFYLKRTGQTPWDNQVGSIALHDNTSGGRMFLRFLMIMGIIFGGLLMLGFVLGILGAITKGLAS